MEGDYLSTKANFMKNIRCQISLGEKIQFWLDVWVGNTPLAGLFPDLFRCVLDKEAKIINYLNRQGSGAKIVWGPTFRRNLKEIGKTS